MDTQALSKPRQPPSGAQPIEYLQRFRQQPGRYYTVGGTHQKPTYRTYTVGQDGRVYSIQSANPRSSTGITVRPAGAQPTQTSQRPATHTVMQLSRGIKVVEYVNQSGKKRMEKQPATMSLKISDAATGTWERLFKGGFDEISYGDFQALRPGDTLTLDHTKGKFRVAGAPRHATPWSPGNKLYILGYETNGSAIGWCRETATEYYVSTRHHAGAIGSLYDPAGNEPPTRPGSSMSNYSAGDCISDDEESMLATTSRSRNGGTIVRGMGRGFRGHHATGRGAPGAQRAPMKEWR